MNFVFIYILFLLDHMECILFSCCGQRERLQVKTFVPLQYIIITWRSFTRAAQVEIVLSMCVCREERSLTFSAESAPPPKI